MQKLLVNIEKLIVDPLLYFMIALALVYFLWGVVEFLMNADEPDARSKGRSHMIWGVVGLAIMVGAFGIVHIIMNTFGIK